MANFTFKYNLDGSNNPPTVKKLPVAASQTLVVGDLVVLSSGQIAKASGSVTEVIGVMAEASTNAAAATMLQVYIIQPSQVWNATADASATSSVLQGKAFDINSDQTIDIGDTAGGCIRIVETVSSATDVNVVFSVVSL